MTDKTELKKELATLLAEKDRRETYDKFHNYYFQDYKLNENGLDISRKNYKAHCTFMDNTAKYKELAFIAPNRSGKSETGSFIVATLAMKDYPKWWKGKRFPDHQPLKIMVLGKSNLAVRDVAQKKLVGSLFDMGSGMIPKEAIVRYRKKLGTPDALQDLYVRDKFGCINHIQFLSYEVDDDVVMGQELNVAWFDEECLRPKLYNEVLMRTMTTEGIVFTTFTPLDGLTPGIMKFMPDTTFPPDGIVRDDEGKETGCYIQHCGWDSAPHLTEEQKEDMKRRYFGDELIARTEGIPTIGEGQIYPFSRDSITCDPFPIPIYWPRVYGFDVGFNKTAAIWIAQDPDTKNLYIYDEYLGRRDTPIVHSAAVRARGKWMWGAVDPAAEKLINPADGRAIFQEYLEQDLNLAIADNALEAGIYDVGMRFQTGQLKIFSTCQQTLKQYSLYRRYEGKIDKKRNPEDDLMDALRYGIRTGLNYLQCPPDPDEKSEEWYYEQNVNSGRSEVTGY